MKLSRKFFAIFFFFAVFELASSLRPRRAPKECQMSRNQLKKLKNLLGKRLGESDTSINCENLIQILKYFLLRVRNDLQDEEEYTEFNEKYTQKNKSFSHDFKEIEKLLKEQRDVLILTDYFEASMSKPKFEGETCTLSTRAHEILKELYQVATQDAATEECSALADKLMNIESLIERGKEYRKKLSDNFDLQPTGLREVVHDLKEELPDNRKEMIKKGKDYIVKSIIDGNYYDAQKTIEIVGGDQYDEVINTVFADKNNLENLVKFIDMNKRSKLSIILDKMVESGDGHNPVILKIAKSLRRTDLNDKTDVVYNSFAEKIPRHNYDSVFRFIDGNTESVDFKRLTIMIYDGKTENFNATTAFIEHYPYKKLENYFYEEMINRRHVDTPEHVYFGLWLRNRIRWIENLDELQSEINKRKRDLLELKEKLPEGIQIMFFEDSFIISRPNHEYLLRALGYESVKFNFVPVWSNENKKNEVLFRFDDTRTNTAPFLVGLDGKQLIMMGDGKFVDGYLWRIIPIDNAQHFLIQNFENGYYMTSEEHPKCRKFERNKKNKDCILYEYYNVAKSAITDDAKWIMTTHIIRKEKRS